MLLKILYYVVTGLLVMLATLSLVVPLAFFIPDQLHVELKLERVKELTLQASSLNMTLTYIGRGVEVLEPGEYRLSLTMHPHCTAYTIVVALTPNMTMYSCTCSCSFRVNLAYPLTAILVYIVFGGPVNAETVEVELNAERG